MVSQPWSDEERQIYSDPEYLSALSKLNMATESPQALHPAKCSIAVLPFDNMSSDSEQEYFADGIAEDLLTELSRLPQLAVISRNSSFVFKGRSVNAQAAGRELGADFILEGSVRRSGGRVRVTAQLIDCASGVHVWAERYDRLLDDIFALQDEIVEAITGGLSMSIEEAATLKRTRDPTHSASAYTAYLQGLAAWRKGDEATCRAFYERALDSDPRFARVLAALAFTFAYNRFSQAAQLDDDRSVALCVEYAEKAIRIDDRDPAVLGELAMARLLLGEPRSALQLTEKCLALVPRSADIIASHGLVLAFCGEHERGLELSRRGIGYMRNVSIPFKMNLTDCLYLAGDYIGALSVYDSILNMPCYGYFLKSTALAQLGRTEEAARTVGEGMKIAPAGFVPAVLARNMANMCALPEDAEHWLAGFRKAGVGV